MTPREISNRCGQLALALAHIAEHDKIHHEEAQKIADELLALKSRIARLGFGVL